MKTSRPLTLTAISFALILPAFLVGGVARAQTDARALLLKRVMLSTGGVGYFEHEAMVTGDTELSLRVRLDQVDDVLKSIVVYDGAGRVGTIGLPGREPLREAFRDLPFDQRALKSPAALLRALKGARVAVTGPRQIVGRVLSINSETLRLPNGGGTIVQHRVTLHTASGLESFILEEAAAVRLSDTTLQGQVNQALAAIARHRVADRRTLKIKVSGAGERKVRVAYVVPVPLWKASYRLTLDRDAKAKSGHLQGWAVVENMTGRNWNGVELALVSGNPVTFRQAIYQAYYVNRPEVPVEVLGRILPRPDRGAVAGLRGGKAATESGRRERELRDAGLKQEKRAMAKSGLGRVAEKAASAPVLSLLVEPGTSKDDSFRAAPPPVAKSAFQARGSESATQVVFRIPRPVSIASGHSLIVPITDRTVPAVRISLYQPNTHADHPVASANLTNGAETGLPGGVLTLYERDGKAGGVAYLGDAQLRTLPPGESRLVGFALDQKTRVERETKHARSLTKGKIARGVFHHTVVDRRTTTYRLKGAAGESRRVVIEHPRLSGWSLEKPDPKKAKVELAKGVYRIAVDLTPGEERKLSAVTNHPRRETLSLISLRPNRVAAFASTDTLDVKVRAAFQRMGEMMAQIARHKNQVEKLTREQKDIFDDQRRIRDNMRRVGNRSQLFQRYSRKLEEQENTLDQLTGRLEAARDAQRKAEKALRDYIAGLNI